MLGLCGTISRSLIRRITTSTEVLGTCKRDKFFARKCSSTVNKSGTATPSKPGVKLDSNARARNSAEKKLADEIMRFNASVEKNKPISAAWCTGLISQATDLQDWRVATFVSRKAKALNIPLDKALFTAILNMHVKHGDQWMKALTYIDKSPDIENLDAKPFHGLINLIRSYNRYDLGMQVYEAMKKKNVAIDAFVANILLGMALRRNDKAMAKRLIEDYKKNGAQDGPLENELIYTLTSCDATLGYILSYLEEPAPKEPKLIILLNHLTESYLQDLSNNQVKHIYATITSHKGLNIQQGLLTVMSKLLGRTGFYHLILDLYLSAIERGVKFDKQFYMETIGQFIAGQKDEYTEKFIALMKNESKIQDTLEFYSKLFMKVNYDPLAVFSLLKRVRARHTVVDPQFALLFVLFLTKSTFNFEVITLDPELVRQVKAWKELIDVNYDTASTMLEMQPAKFWSLVERCSSLFEAALQPKRQ